MSDNLKNTIITSVLLVSFSFGAGACIGSGLKPNLATPTPSPTPSFLTTQATYNAAILADGPIAYWPLNEGNLATPAADLTGNLFTGVCEGGQSFSSGRFFGDDSSDVSLVVITGGNGGVTIAKRMAQAFANVTVEGWVKKAPGDQNGSVFNRDTWDFGDGFGLEFNGSGEIIFGHGGGGFRVVGTTNVQDSNWHYVVGIMQTDLHDANCVYSVYVDGVLQTTSAPQATCIDASGADNGGANGSISLGHYDFYEGQLSSVGVYDKVLTPVQITSHYLAGISTH